MASQIENLSALRTHVVHANHPHHVRLKLADDLDTDADEFMANPMLRPPNPKASGEPAKEALISTLIAAR